MEKSKFELKCEMAATILNGIISNTGLYQSFPKEKFVKESVELAEMIYQEVKRGPVKT